MNLIEGGRPRIGCIRRQPSARSLILSLAEGHPSMGKMSGSSRKKGGGLQEHRSFPGTVFGSRRRPGRFHPRPGRIEPWLREAPGENVKVVAQNAEQNRERLISRSRGTSSNNRARNA
jgi:hypothetical protein